MLRTAIGVAQRAIIGWPYVFLTGKNTCGK
jgi:hypothetical protein